MIESSGLPVVEIKFLEKRYERPPKVVLLFDVTLHNNRPESRWFLLPDNLFPSSGGVKGGGVNGVEVFELGGKGRVVIGRLLGTDGFNALLLPAGARVTIRRFPISVWEKLPEGPLAVEVIVANQLTVGGEATTQWFDKDPMSDIQANVSYDQRKVLGSKYTTNMKEIPLSFVEDQRVTVEVGV